jgi:hypothetical protein
MAMPRWPASLHCLLPHSPQALALINAKFSNFDSPNDFSLCIAVPRAVGGGSPHWGEGCPYPPGAATPGGRLPKAPYHLYNCGDPEIPLSSKARRYLVTKSNSHWFRRKRKWQRQSEATVPPSSLLGGGRQAGFDKAAPGGGGGTRNMAGR